MLLQTIWYWDYWLEVDLCYGCTGGALSNPDPPRVLHCNSMLVYVLHLSALLSSINENKLSTYLFTTSQA